MAERKPTWFDVPADAEIAYCATCGAGIYWIETKAGKRMPLSARTMQSHPFTRSDGTSGETRQALSHFTDCPDAKQHRRRRT